MIYVSRVVPGEWLEWHLNTVLSCGFNHSIDMAPQIFQLRGPNGPVLRADDAFRVIWRIHLDAVDKDAFSVFNPPDHYPSHLPKWS